MAIDRREFIKGTAAATSAAAIGGIALAAPDTLDWVRTIITRAFSLDAASEPVIATFTQEIQSPLFPHTEYSGYVREHLAPQRRENEEFKVYLVTQFAIVTNVVAFKNGHEPTLRYCGEEVGALV